MIRRSRLTPVQKVDGVRRNACRLHALTHLLVARVDRLHLDVTVHVEEREVGCVHHRPPIALRDHRLHLLVPPTGADVVEKARPFRLQPRLEVHAVVQRLAAPESALATDGRGSCARRSVRVRCRVAGAGARAWGREDAIRTSTRSPRSGRGGGRRVVLQKLLVRQGVPADQDAAQWFLVVPARHALHPRKVFLRLNALRLTGVADLHQHDVARVLERACFGLRRWRAVHDRPRLRVPDVRIRLPEQHEQAFDAVILLRHGDSLAVDHRWAAGRAGVSRFPSGCLRTARVGNFDNDWGKRTRAKVGNEGITKKKHKNTKTQKRKRAHANRPPHPPHAPRATTTR